MSDGYGFVNQNYLVCQFASILFKMYKLDNYEKIYTNIKEI